MKVFTIINENKIIGTVKLIPEIVKHLAENKDRALLLTRDQLAGDGLFITFRLQIIKVGQNKL